MVKKKNHRQSRRLRGVDRRYTVRGIRREPVDIEKLSKALLGLVVADLEKQAQAEHVQDAGNGDQRPMGRGEGAVDG
ncbi:hypothetical protein IOD16_30840 [Saccharothrix sp. 6-C]|uniref:hypothetical protein n=1 Tax=Saccharothrix sp. 6-C TaxID=2781735 RepID=UPI001916E145|nr:hypothetical protein [Saccharothrix sp. 6-C]QQQ75451.1 hypothetical protein IOD16_30840 [Saccharothrix sp. 6-C]